LSTSHHRHRKIRHWLRGGAAAAVPFNVFDDAEDLINDTWGAEVPVFVPDPGDTGGPVFRDAPPVINTVRALAELVYYSKKKARGLAPGEADWIKDSFGQHDPEDYLPRLRPLLERHFLELVQGPHRTSPYASAEEEAAASSSRWWELARPSTQRNYFYIQDYRNIPNPPTLDALLTTCGISPEQRPDNHDFLIQTYHRVHVRLDRFIALSHLLIAGAQSETVVNRITLEREYRLQEKLKELKASYLVEHATMQLAYAKRRHGPLMLEKLNHKTGFENKHGLALEAIENRLSVGTEQYPAIVNATHRMQRIYFGLGQLLLGGFLAAEVIKSVTEWSAVYLHRDPYSFVAELAKLVPGSARADIEALQHQFHVFEMKLVYLTVVSVLSVVGIALYYRLKNRFTQQDQEKGGGHHH
jgi:hypothetical protein